jgi:hypothetical protein
MDGVIGRPVRWLACRDSWRAISGWTGRDEKMIAVLLEFAERFTERGFSKLSQLVRRRGHGWNHKRV